MVDCFYFKSLSVSISITIGFVLSTELFFRRFKLYVWCFECAPKIAFVLKEGGGSWSEDYCRLALERLPIWGLRSVVLFKRELRRSTIFSFDFFFSEESSRFIYVDFAAIDSGTEAGINSWTGCYLLAFCVIPAFYNTLNCFLLWFTLLPSV